MIITDKEGIKYRLTKTKFIIHIGCRKFSNKTFALIQRAAKEAARAKTR